MTVQLIRQHYRKTRQALSSDELNQNALLLKHRIDSYLGRIRAQKIAAYLSVQGEISLNPWIAGNQKHKIYLPKLYEVTTTKLRFAALSEKTVWTHNRFKILEPDCGWGETLEANQLDIILMPLVAFDSSGNRLGMGGGYYDRSLAFRRSRTHWLKPRLVGVAHSCQQHPQLPQQAWDIPLDCIITENEIIYPAG
ncbi:MAG: 5-formyltetrahydrofolate cyclo-ligase [Gammaproteobacteria bacterium]|nr:5-formyltetrahydrofolate cyclo-ligase [Gammaproteobacteria bacterium]MBL6999469.1 5-formyltetrahydrofolate cyclo-ligase [Gammaproteobacteria bacterium]